MCKTDWLTCLFLICSLHLVSFNLSIGQEGEYLEGILDIVDEEDAENAGWLEYLWELRENPLNLNDVKSQELHRIPFLSPHMVDKILKYRDEKGEINNIHQLTEIDGMSEELVGALENFLTVKPPSISTDIVYRLQMRYETPKREGYRRDIYREPIYLQHRTIFNVGRRISGGMLWEKDAGETNYSDYRSLHLRYQNPNNTFSLLAGDYHMKIGTGLAFWSPYGFPLSAESVPLLPRLNSPLDENRSSSESGFLRGIASSFQITSHFSANIFYSKSNLDATISDDDSLATSVFVSGLHRTENERSKINTLGEQIIGGTINAELNDAEVQLSAIQSKYNPSFKDNKSVQNHISISYEVSAGNLRPAGEMVLYQNKFPAVQQYLYIFGEKMRYELAGYYYHPKYFASRGRAFGSLSQSPDNKKGAAIFLTYKLAPDTRIGGYAHFYQKVHDSQANPFFRRDYLIQIKQKLWHQWFRIQYRQKYRENDIEQNNELQKILRSLRLEQKTKLNRFVRLQNRLELHWANPLDKNHRYYGISLFHQLTWQYFEPLRIIARWTTFDVPDYDLRIYEFEPDLPGNFRTVLLNDRGYKVLFLIRWRPISKIQLDFKYQQRFYPDETTVGSGLDEFETNRIHNFRLSFIWRF